MSVFSKVATAAALMLGLIGAATSAPGFAQQVPATLNVSAAALIPGAGLPLIPAIETITPSAAADPVSADRPDDPDYPTLEAAVAAQAQPESVSDALHCLAASVYYESKGEPLSGQLAVAEVILNRAKSGRFPPAVCAVVTQPGQFSFVKSGQVPDVGSNPQWRTALAVAQVALAGAWDSPAPDALYFHARRVSPGWHAVKIAAIGNHIFFR